VIKILIFVFSIDLDKKCRKINTNIINNTNSNINTNIMSKSDITNGSDVKEKSIEDEQLKKCEHYDIGCHLIFDCCGLYYPCRFCHDNDTSNPRFYGGKLDLVHEHDKNKITQMICRYCLEIQELSDECKKCSKKMGNYFCKECKLLDLVDKGQFHCDKCGMCRKGGRDNYDHCDKCGICVSKSNDHKCAMTISGDCPICCENLFNSILSAVPMKCGHWMHAECFDKFRINDYKCPVCCKSMIDTKSMTEALDEIIKSQPMPKELQDKIVKIMCNDCGEISSCNFHFHGHKCSKCTSYNTKLI
jgi:RING finger and CHY zinc finger domain-containing protein 1